MSFYGFDSQEDFNEYRLLTECDVDSGSRTSSTTSGKREESSSSYRTASYRSSSKKVPLTPEEKKEMQMRNEQARLERKLQGRGRMDSETKSALIFLFSMMVFGVSIAAGYYWESYSIVVKKALHLQVPRPEYVFDYPMEEEEIEYVDEETEQEMVQDEVGTGGGYQPAAQVPKSSGGSYGYSSTRYGSNDDYDDDDDDDDTWYRGEDDPDEYYEYDYHE